MFQGDPPFASFSLSQQSSQGVFLISAVQDASAQQAIGQGAGQNAAGAKRLRSAF
jgi:hypothetical protein